MSEVFRTVRIVQIAVADDLVYALDEAGRMFVARHVPATLAEYAEMKDRGRAPDGALLRWIPIVPPMVKM